MSRSPKLYPAKPPISGIFSTSQIAYGVTNLPVYLKGQKYVLHCQVVDEDVPNLLSATDSQKMNLVQRLYPVNFEETKNIIHAYSHVFQGVGKIPKKYSLKVNPEVPPTTHNARPIPAAL